MVGTTASAQLLSAHSLHPPTGDAQDLGDFSNTSPAPAMERKAFQPCNNSGEVLAEVSHTTLYLPIPPAPPSHSLHGSGSEELATTTN